MTPSPIKLVIVRRVAGRFAPAESLELRLVNARRQIAALTPSLPACALSIVVRLILPLALLGGGHAGAADVRVVNSAPVGFG